MPLVKRLCQLQIAEWPDDGVEPGREIAIGPFMGALISVLNGDHTLAQVKSYYNMTPAEEDQLDILQAKIVAGQKLENRLLLTLRLFSIFLWWQRIDDYPIPGYMTVSDIRSRINDL